MGASPGISLSRHVRVMMLYAARPLVRYSCAGCVRGFVDNIAYYIKKRLLWIPEMLESLSNHLKEKLGDKWWVGTALEQFAPER